MLARAGSVLRGKNFIQLPCAAVLPGSAAGSRPAHALAAVIGCDGDVGALAFLPHGTPAAAVLDQTRRRHQSAQGVGAAKGQAGMEPGNHAADGATPHQPPLLRNTFLDPGGSSAAGAQSSTVVAVLNWTLPECTSRLLQSGEAIIMFFVSITLSWRQSMRSQTRLTEELVGSHPRRRQHCSQPINTHEVMTEINRLLSDTSRLRFVVHAASNEPDTLLTCCSAEGQGEHGMGVRSAAALQP